MKESGWIYYLPESGETLDDAVPIQVRDWDRIPDAESAAERAAEHEWNERDGWDAGMSHEPLIVVISPLGEETRWRVSREAEVVHRPRPEKRDA